MGKIVTLYLTDEEATELKEFCNENQCTQYSALKTATKELLSKPTEKIEEKSLIIHEEEKPSEKDSEDNEMSEERRQEEEADTSEPRRYLIELIKKKE